MKIDDIHDSISPKRKFMDKCYPRPKTFEVYYMYIGAMCSIPRLSITINIHLVSIFQSSEFSSNSKSFFSTLGNGDVIFRDLFKIQYFDECDQQF